MQHSNAIIRTGMGRATAITCIISIACLVVLFMFSLPVTSYAASATFEWNPVAEEYIAGYRIFFREVDQLYDYSAPCWEGSETTCTIELPEGTTAGYFVVRAFDKTNHESVDSNEIGVGLPDPTETEEDSSQYHPPFEEPPVTDDTAAVPETPTIVQTNDDPNQFPLTPELRTSEFKGAVVGDSHLGTRWMVYRSSDERCVFNLYTETYLTVFTLPPLVLDGETQYYWTAQHYAQNGAVSSPAENRSFTTIAWLADSNANGLHDGYELVTATDLDGNGQADEDQTDMTCINGAYDNQIFGIKTGTDGLPTPLQAVQPIDAAAVASPPSGLTADLPAGLMNFKLSTGQSGATVAVNIYLSSAISSSDYWINYHPGLGYGSFVADSSISVDRKVVTIELTDGGEGDMDGYANGQIVAMGGYGRITGTTTNPATLTSDSTAQTESKEAGCFIQSIVAP